MAIIEKYRHGPSEQSGSQNQINSMISVDVARHDPEAASTCDNLNELRMPGCGELKLNPIVSTGKVASSRLNVGKVRTKIAVKIRDRERLSWPNESERHLRDICVRGCATANKTKEEQREQKTNEITRCCG